MRGPDNPWDKRTPRGRPGDALARGDGAAPPARSRAREPLAATTPERDAAPHEAVREQRHAELRLYGLNAVRAMFARRPQALRKLYLSQARVPDLRPLLQWCVARRVGYRVVEDASHG